MVYILYHSVVSPFAHIHHLRFLITLSKIWGNVCYGNGKGVRVHPYAYSQHQKMLKHLVYVCHGCVIQSEVVYSINHSLVAGSQSAPTLPYLGAWNAYAYPQHQKVFKHLVYVYHILLTKLKWLTD